MLDNYLIDDIKSALAKLLNERLQEIGRAANMLWICFGDDKIYINLKGQPIVQSEYALHVQCDWEILNGNEIMLDQEYFYHPKDEATLQLFEEEHFGNSKFDESAIKFNAAIKANPTHVVSFEVYMTCGFKLVLSNNFTINVYPYSSLDGESWRFLPPDFDEKHLVVFEDED